MSLNILYLFYLYGQKPLDDSRIKKERAKTAIKKKKLLKKKQQVKDQINKPKTQIIDGRPSSTSLETNQLMKDINLIIQENECVLGVGVDQEQAFGAQADYQGQKYDDGLKIKSPDFSSSSTNHPKFYQF